MEANSKEILSFYSLNSLIADESSDIFSKALANWAFGHSYYLKGFIKEAEELLSVPSNKKKKATSQTRRKEVLLAEVVGSSAYKKYVKKQGEMITKSEFCYLLQGTLDSSRELLKENLLSLKKFSQELEREDITKFLDWLEGRFKNWLLNTSN